MEINNESNAIKILMLPWLAHGHISPFLELAKRLTKRNFHVYLCSTPINLSSIKPKISHRYSKSIQLVEIHLPSLPDLPQHYHTTKDLPPHLMPALKAAFDMASPSFDKILKTLSPHLLIYDFLQPWAPAMASSLNIPAVLFLSVGASMTAFSRHRAKKISGEFPFPAIYIRDYELPKLRSLFNNTASGIRDVDRVAECHQKSLNIILIKTFRELEGKYIDYVSSISSKKIVPVGPLVDQDLITEKLESEEEIKIMQWLDKKQKSSTVFVSFGTECFLSKEEIEEIAYGLKLSNVNFVWVIRFPIGEKITIEEALPRQYLKRVGDKAMVVEDWAPQGKILGHKSIGGFVSHCGWGSIMESMKYGVPIIALPVHLDQPVNARLAQEVGVGVEVKKDSNGKVQREEVARIIKEVVMGSNGESVRNKARELKEIFRNKGDEEIDEVVEELVQLLHLY